MALCIVVSGAPGTGKTTVAALLAERLVLPLLSLDVIKEALGDSLGLGDEDWSDRMGDAAAAVLFDLAAAFPGAVVEGWWRRARRTERFRSSPAGSMSSATASPGSQKNECAFGLAQTGTRSTAT